jgi:hypothetical protein
LPGDSYRRQKWINAIKSHLGEDWDLDTIAGNKKIVFCSDHFEKSDFYQGVSNRCLRKTAVPTIFNGFQRQNVAVPAEISKDDIIDSDKEIVAESISIEDESEGTPLQVKNNSKKNM